MRRKPLLVIALSAILLFIISSEKEKSVAIPEEAAPSRFDNNGIAKANVSPEIKINRKA